VTSHADPTPPTVRGLLRLDAPPPPAPTPVGDATREALAWELARLIADTTTPWGKWDGTPGYHLRQSSKRAADAVLARLGDLEPESVRAQRIRAEVAEGLAEKRGEYASAHGKALTALVDQYQAQAADARRSGDDDARYWVGLTEGLRIARRVWVYGLAPAEPAATEGPE
jgi:hypothetical protein